MRDVVVVVEEGNMRLSWREIRVSTMIGSELNVMDERRSSFLSQALSGTNNIVCHSTHFLPQD